MVYSILPITIVLRGRLPRTPEEFFACGTFFILFLFYAFRKEEWFTDVLKWTISGIMLIAGCIGMVYFEKRWYQFFCWTLTSPIIYVILYSLFRQFMLRRKRSEAYLYEKNPEELDRLSDQEDLDMHKIITVGVVIWFFAGLFIV